MALFFHVAQRTDVPGEFERAQLRPFQFNNQENTISRPEEIITLGPLPLLTIVSIVHVRLISDPTVPSRPILPALPCVQIVAKTSNIPQWIPHGLVNYCLFLE